MSTNEKYLQYLLLDAGLNSGIMKADFILELFLIFQCDLALNEISFMYKYITPNN